MEKNKGQTPQEMVTDFLQRYPDLMGMLRKFFAEQLKSDSLDDISCLIHIIAVLSTITRIEFERVDKLMTEKDFENLFHNV